MPPGSDEKIATGYPRSYTDWNWNHRPNDVMFILFNIILILGLTEVIPIDDSKM